MFQNGDNARHMGRKGAEALFDALLVADIRIYFRKNRQFGSIQGRNMEAGLPHEGKQTDCF